MARSICRIFLNWLLNGIQPKMRGNPLRITLLAPTKNFGGCVQKVMSGRQTVHHRSSGGGCLACFNENRSEIMRPKTSADFNLFTENPTVCADWDYEKNEYPPTHYLPTSAAKVHWKCSAGDDHSWAARIDSRTLPDDGVKNKCPFCTGRKPSKGYNLAVINPYLVAEWHSEKNKKSPSDYTPSSNQKFGGFVKKGMNGKLRLIIAAQVEIALNVLTNHQEMKSVF